MLDPTVQDDHDQFLNDIVFEDMKKLNPKYVQLISSAVNVPSLPSL